MSETEIALARAYLARSGQDPVAALIRSVKDLARMRRLLGARSPIEIEPARVTTTGRGLPAAR